jgi:maleamate amidohydrolase
MTDILPDELDANYARAGYHHRLEPGKRPALLVIDMVQAYFEPSSPLYAGVDAALASTLKLIDAARIANIPVIFTNVVITQGLFDGGIFARKVPALSCFAAGSPLGKWPNGLEPLPTDLIISKLYPSAFFGTALAPTLTASGIDTLILCGLTTSGCVRATCVDTMSYGFIPVVVSDACGDRAEGPHQANLFDMGAKYAEVIGENAAIQYILSTGP